MGWKSEGGGLEGKNGWVGRGQWMGWKGVKDRLERGNGWVGRG